MAKKAWCCENKHIGCHKSKPKQSCKLWGDPHIITFDSSRLVFYSEGDFWIVKSDALKIQGRFESTGWTKRNDGTDYSSMTAIVLTGDMLDSNVIDVEDATGQIMCNKQPILTGFGETMCGPARVTYDDKGALVDDAMSFLTHRVVHIFTPHGGVIQVNRWPNFINAMITMHSVNGQDGVCGNYNGNAEDDSGAELHRRFGSGVHPTEDLFPRYLPLHVPEKKPSPKRCSEEKLLKYQKLCIHKVQHEKDWSLFECMGDYCDASTSATTGTAGEVKAALAR